MTRIKETPGPIARKYAAIGPQFSIFLFFPEAAFTMHDLLLSEHCKGFVWQSSAGAFTRLQKIVHCECSRKRVHKTSTVEEGG